MRTPILSFFTFLGSFLVMVLHQGDARAGGPDWSRIPTKQIPVFYPGPAGLEWTLDSARHSGARKLTEKKMSCFDCHEYDADKIGEDIVTGKKVGKSREIIDNKVAAASGTFPLNIQAAHDDQKLYLRFEWESPAPDQRPHADPLNEIKLTFMFDQNKVEGSALNGCWATCHMDLRSMPDAAKNASRHRNAKALGWTDGVTKYIGESRTALSIDKLPRGGWNKLRSKAEIATALKEGHFLDLIQYRSGRDAKPIDGYVLESRHMEGGKSLLKASSERQGQKWIVTFERLLAGVGPGDHTINPEQRLTFGVAIHEQYGTARHHHVSLGYTLGLHDPDAFVNAVQLDPARPTATMAARSSAKEKATPLHH